MRVLDLFSGIGGFSLGLERAGMTTIGFCEIDPYCQGILRKHWPEVPIYDDIKTITYAPIVGPQTGEGRRGALCERGAVERPAGCDSLASGERTNIAPIIGPVDLVCGGFPCQPFSQAGQRRGSEDDRALWPEMLRIIREVQPTWVIGENVIGLETMGLEHCVSDLESNGFAVQVFDIPACGVGAIHRRHRLWIVAHAERNDRRRDEPQRRQERRNAEPSGHGGEGIDPDTKPRIAGGRQSEHAEQQGSCGNQPDGRDSRGRWDGEADPNTGRRHGEGPRSQERSEAQEIGWPTEPPVCGPDDEIPDRVARLKALGNAVVPDIPEMIGRAIMEIEVNSGHGD